MVNSRLGTGGFDSNPLNMRNPDIIQVTYGPREFIQQYFTPFLSFAIVMELCVLVVSIIRAYMKSTVNSSGVTYFGLAAALRRASLQFYAASWKVKVGTGVRVVLSGLTLRRVEGFCENLRRRLLWRKSKFVLALGGAAAVLLQLILFSSALLVYY